MLRDNDKKKHEKVGQEANSAVKRMIVFQLCIVKGKKVLQAYVNMILSIILQVLACHPQISVETL